MKRAAVAVAAGILAAAARATAAPPVVGAPPAVAIAVAGDADGAIADRLRTELDARGFDVRAAPMFDPADRVAPGLSAILRVIEARGRVEIWTPETDGASARFRTTIAAQGAGDPTLAVRAAEGVRAFVTAPPEGQEPPPTPPGPAQATPPRVPGPPATPFAGAITSATPGPTSGFALGVDAALLVPAGGSSAGGAALVRLRHRLSPHLALGARLMLPVVPTSVANSIGSATLDASMLAAELAVGLGNARTGSAWDVRLIAGVGLAWLRMTGVAAAPFFGARDDLWTALPYGALEISRELGARLALRASAIAGVAAPSATIRFAGVPFSRWGDPLALLALGADFDL